MKQTLYLFLFIQLSFAINNDKKSNKIVANLQEEIDDEVELINPVGGTVMNQNGKGQSNINPHFYTPISNVHRASSTIVGDVEGSEVKGIIDFCQSVLPFEPVLITMNVTGLPMGKHAVHIHSYGDLHAGCKSTGSHFHKNLIGNVEVKEDGALALKFSSSYVQLFGPYGIVGRSIVIHEKPIVYNRFPDIYHTPFYDTPLGVSHQYQSEEELVGNIIACGIITIVDYNK